MEQILENRINRVIALLNNVKKEEDIVIKQALIQNARFILTNIYEDEDNNEE